MADRSDISPIDFAQQLKQNVPIDEVIAEYVPTLVRRGNVVKGLCPFHKEKTPSFNVNQEFGFYHCFGCGAHGDVIKFIQEIEKVDFMMALELLARRSRIAMPEFRGGGHDDAHEQRLVLLREVCNWAQEFFVGQLSRNPRGKAARDYLLGRGLSDDDIRDYGLGYAPDGYEVMLAAAHARSYSGDVLAEAGLASRRDHGGFVDRFRDRVMFPIEDRAGQVVAFGGRILEKDVQAAKYINSAETPIFKKSHILYGMPRAREAIRDQQEVILLEGYMDWISLHRRGVRNVLAGMGTALTEDQVRLIKRICPRVHLLYDGDEAGQKAMFRSAQMIMREGLSAQAAVLPAEHDPDSFIASEGTQALRDLLSRAPAVVDYFTEQIAQASQLDRPEGKADAVDRLGPLLTAIEDPVLREVYISRAAQRFGLRVETMETALKRRQRTRVYRREEDESPIENEEVGFEASATEQNLLYIILRSMGNWELLQSVEVEWFENAMIKSMFERVYDIQRDVREGAEPPASPFDICDSASQREWMRRILLLPVQRFGGEVDDMDQFLADATSLQILKMKKKWLERRKRQLRQDLQIILGEKEDKHQHLSDMEALSRENIRDHQAFFKQSD